MKKLAIDIETSGLNFLEDCIVSISFYNKNKNKFIALYHKQAKPITEQDFVNQCNAIIDKADLLIFHNFQFDYLFLKKMGINLDNKTVYDTMIAEYLLTAQQSKFSKLNELAKKYLNEEKVDIDIVNADSVDIDLLEAYNNKDTELTYKIYKEQTKLMSNKLYRLALLHSNFSKVLASITLNGFKIDVDKLNNLKKEIKNKLDILEKEMQSLLERPINLSSPIQLSAALFGGTFKEDGYETVIKHYKKGDKEIKRAIKIDVTLKGLGFSTTNIEQCKSGYYSTSIDTIKKLKPRNKIQKEFINKYIEYNELNSLYEKYLTKYTNFLTKDNFIHAHFNQCSTSTGRLSCNNPNIQQIPRDESIKNIFTSRYPEGCIVDIDFSQLEWRVCAYLCQDKTMIKEIEQGIDAHKANASLAFGKPADKITDEERQLAKAVSFGLIYGQTAKGMTNRFDITIEKAQAIIDAIYNKYQDLKKWHDKLYYTAINKKYIETSSGRIFRFINADKELTKIKNYPVQSFATADIVPLMIYKIWLKIKDREDIKIVNTVHDCIVLDCKDIDTANNMSDYILRIFNNSAKYISKFFDIDFNVELKADKKIKKVIDKN